MLRVCTIRLRSPGCQRTFIGMEAPDLLVATVLIVYQLLFNIIRSSRTRPYFHDQRHRLGEYFECAGTLTQPLFRLTRNHADTGDVEVSRRNAKPRRTHIDGVD